MYYRIDISLDLKVIGKYSQAEHAEYTCDLNDPNFSGNINQRKADDVTKVKTPLPILVKKAKLTDLISASMVGVNLKLIISEKFKNLLEKQNHLGLQFFPMSVIYQGKEVKDYWLANPFIFNNHVINFKESIIEIEGLGGTKLRDIAINNFEEYTSIVNSLVMPERLAIKKLVLQKNIEQDLILLIKVYGGIGYYVSEKLKNEIVEAGCTGIEFEPVEQA